MVGFTARIETATGWEWLLGELWSAVVDMGREGLFSSEEQQCITIPIGLRAVEELQAPFRKCGSCAGLAIERIELLQLADPFWAEFQRTGDHKAFAQRHADTTQAWAGPTIAKLIDASRD